MVKRFAWFILAGLLTGCATWQSPGKLEWSQVQVEAKSGSDPELAGLLKPYADSVSSLMDETMGMLGENLTKSDDGNSLGYFIADAILWGAREVYGKADLAIMNQGGIRLQQLTAGPLTRGKLYELMPFDNVIVLIELSGEALKQLIQERRSNLKAWPVAGLTAKKNIQGELEWFVGTEPLSPTATYALAISDYLADGGDNLNLLKTLPRQNKGYLQRDAILHYVAWHQAKGQAVSLPNMVRISQ